MPIFFSLQFSKGLQRPAFIFSLILAAISSSCMPVPDAAFYSAEGVVSIEAESHADIGGWRQSHYYTSIGLTSVNDTIPASTALEYTFYITESGNYAIWLLSRKFSDDPSDNYLPLQITENNGNLILDDQLELPQSNALEWKNLSFENQNQLFANFSSRGFYSLRIDSKGMPGYRLDKIHLSLDNEIKPEGMGLPETTDPDVDPVELKRSRPVILPPAWAFGVLYGGYTNQEETMERVRRLHDEGYPVDAYWIDSWFWDYQNEGKGPDGYIDFRGDTAAYPDMQAMWDFLEERNVKAGIWIWNTILKDGNEEVYSDFEERGFFSETYLNTDRWHNRDGNSMTGDIDFSNPEAARYFREKLKPFFEKGLDFLKLDRSSDIDFTRTAFEAIQQFSETDDTRGFVLAHLHSTHNPDFKLYPTKWTGDAKTGWSQPDYPDFNIFAMGGLKENIEMAANPRLTTYEIPFLTHDMGGYNFFGTPEISDELYIRWTQFSAFNPVMHVFSTADNPAANMPFNFSETAQDNFKKYMRLRMRLFPYIYTHAHNSRQGGPKIIRGDGIHTTQYMFGGAFLVAPVYEPGTSDRMVYLPEGHWFGYWSQDRFEGGKSWFVDAPLTKVPLFVKAGSIIPYRNYSQSVETGNNDFLLIEIYPDDAGAFRLSEDDGKTTRYREGEWARTMLRYNQLEGKNVFTIGAVQGGFTGMKMKRSYELRFIQASQPARVRLNGDELPQSSSRSQTGWRYEDETNRLVIFLPDRDKGEKVDVEIEF